MASLMKYERYKPSGIEWIGEVPEHWKIGRLKNIASNVSTRSTEISEDDFVVALENIESNSGKFIESSAEYENTGILFLKSHILYNKLRPYLNKVYLAESNGVCVGDIIVIACSSSILPRFLQYKMLSDGFCSVVMSSVQGTKMPRTSWEFISSLKFGLPPFPEQLSIASYLDNQTRKIDQLIANKRAQLEKLRELRQIEINTAVTKGLNPHAEMKDSGIEWLGKIPKHWEVKRLKKFTTKIGSGVTPKGGSEVYEESGVPMFRSQNIHFDGLRTDDIVYITKDVHESMSGSKVEPNDVLLNITGASIGRCYYYDGSLGEANVNQHVCIIRTNSKLNHRYLQQFMSSDCAQSQILKGQTGTSREGLTFQDIRNMVIPTPPPKEQLIITDFIRKRTDLLDRLILKMEVEIEQLHELRKVRIFEAVTGKVKVPTYGEAVA